MNNAGLVFPSERPVFLREVNNNMYSVSAYYCSKVVSELPAAIFVPSLQATIIYFAVGFNTELWYKFPIFLSIALLIYNGFTGFGYVLGAAIAHQQLIAVFTPMIIVPTMLMSGFFVKQDNIPKFPYFIRETAIVKYGYQAFFLNEF